MSRRNPGAETATGVRAARERLAVTLGAAADTRSGGNARAPRHAADSRVANRDSDCSPGLLAVPAKTGFDGKSPAGNGHEGWTKGAARLRARTGLRAAVLLGVVAVILGCYWWQAGIGGSGSGGSGSGGAGIGGAGVAPLSDTAPAAAEEPAGATVAPASPSGGDSGDGPASITVHVAGAVAVPGVVQLPSGSRLHEAIRAAGGATATADPDRLNLAAVLEDGQKVFVPAKGEPDQADEPGQTGGAGGAETTGPGGGGHKINLNTAALEELGTLPRVGPVLAQRIVDWRREHGRFKTVQELDAVEGIGPKLLQALLPLVSV